MIAKGRHARGERHAVHKNPLLVTGEKNPRAKLNAKSVLMIRSLYKTGGYRMVDLGYRFGVSQAQAYRVISGKAWASIAPEEF
jgi:hypothetical protein